MRGETVAEADAKIIIEARVPARTTVELCTNEAAVILNEADTTAVFGSNQTAAESIIAANKTCSSAAAATATSSRQVSTPARP